MAVGKGGSEGNQNQSSSYNGQTAGTSDTSTAGTSNVNSTGTTTGQTAGQVTADPTAGYGNVSDIVQRLTASGGNGLTPEQQAALTGIQGSAADVTGKIDYGNSVLSQYVGDNHPAYQSGGTSTVSAPSASSLISSYMTPYQQQVVDAAGADSNQNFAKNLNTLHAEYGGQSGNGREGVAAGQALDDSTRSYNDLVSGLLNTGYTTALGGAENEAGNDLTASGQNAALTQGNNQFNVGANQANDAQSIGVVQDYLNNTVPTENAIQTGDASTIAGMSGSGVSQMLQYLQSQVPAFGQSSTGNTTGTQTGNQTGNTTGTSNTDMTGTSSGSSVGSGSNSGKNGGISFG